jgi:hypothetical protein
MNTVTIYCSGCAREMKYPRSIYNPDAEYYCGVCAEEFDFDDGSELPGTCGEFDFDDISDV